MSQVSSIEIRNLYLDYPLVGTANLSLKTRLLGAATGGLIASSKTVSVVKALQDISMSLGEGDRLGLVGHNGAGKSTLLKVLAGIYQPTAGFFRIQGRVVSTLNISLGMEPEATGLENIMIRGLLLGMKRREVSQKLDEIAAFTELGDYLNLPVRIYSSGMTTRLAFATITAIDSDILLMDEMIGAGDAAFMEKAEKRLSEFMNRSKIIVLASHSDSVIKRFCNKALLLEHGRVTAHGNVEDVLGVYHNRTVEMVGG
ncbi:ABC transporter ATP-binding protein [Nitrospira sp. BLG_1]|uniref:ABC transporter ATP-binding protein n=1 Tax=Nitrospira sp. BLG_1 TaxID=3395883 RepID=UPI0039BCA680